MVAAGEAAMIPGDPLTRTDAEWHWLLHDGEPCFAGCPAWRSADQGMNEATERSSIMTDQTPEETPAEAQARLNREREESNGKETESNESAPESSSSE